MALGTLGGIVEPLTLTQVLTGTTATFSGTITSNAAAGTNALLLNNTGAKLRLHPLAEGDNNSYLVYNGTFGGIQCPTVMLADRFYAGSTLGVYLSQAGGKVQIHPGIYLNNTDDSANAGDRTVNQSAGKSAIATSDDEAIITCDKCTSTSLVFITPIDINATLVNWKVVAGNGLFTVTGNAAATVAAWRFQWMVIS